MPNPSIEEEEVEGPVFVIGLPRRNDGPEPARGRRSPIPLAPHVGVLVAVPAAGVGDEHSDPRIAEAEAGLAMMYETFPLMRSMHHQEATTATECQDLLGMSFRTVHFDGFGRVPSYMQLGRRLRHAETYRYHRRVLQLLQWHCPPRLWHLKTPVHMFALDALLEAYPDARFLWSHRDPAKVLGSVCSLIHYTRSWSSDRDDYLLLSIGAEQLQRWWTGRVPRDGLPAVSAANVSPTVVSRTSRWIPSAASARPSSASASGSPTRPATPWRAGRKPPTGFARPPLLRTGRLRAVRRSGARSDLGRLGVVRCRAAHHDARQD